MDRTIILPTELDDRLTQPTYVKQETNGILLYRPKNDGRCPIEGIYMTGVGSEGHVRADDDRIKVANKFFKKFPLYKYIKFHVHTKETIARYGRQFANNFSGGDLASYAEQLQHDPEFIAMLVTPEKKLLHGAGQLSLRTAEKLREYDERSAAISEMFAEISRQVGIDQERLRATRRR